MHNLISPIKQNARGRQALDPGTGMRALLTFADPAPSTSPETQGILDHTTFVEMGKCLSLID